MTPQKIIHFYSPDEWEEFTLEWVFEIGKSYHQVKRFGGPNDRGADVAAFATPTGFQSEWDCYQCKHYNDPLLPGTALPEILKVLQAVIGGHYVMPRAYFFLAPKGVGPTLNKLLSAPNRLKSRFLDDLKDVTKSLGSDLSDDDRTAVRELAEKTDFSIFKSIELHEVLAIHKTTPFYVSRFGGGLPARPVTDNPPESPTPSETRYLQQLMGVYEEHYPESPSTIYEVTRHPRASEHLTRQREAFYSAEALRVFARASLPPGTFEALQEDVFDGVVEIHDSDHPTGMARLRNVLMAAGALPVFANALISVSKTRDKTGICHQLANEDRLVWRRQ